MEFGIGAMGHKSLNDGATRRSKKFYDWFSRFRHNTGCDSQPGRRSIYRAMLRVARVKTRSVRWLDVIKAIELDSVLSLPCPSLLLSGDQNVLIWVIFFVFCFLVVLA